MPFPARNPRPGRADLHAASLIVTLAEAADLALAAEFYRDYPHRLHLTAPLRLHYLVWQAATGFFAEATALEQDLAGAETAGLALVQGLLPDHPGATLEEMLPVSTAWQEGDPAMAWVVWQELYPPESRCPNDLERALVRLLGLYGALARDIAALRKAAAAGDG